VARAISEILEEKSQDHRQEIYINFIASMGARDDDDKRVVYFK